MESLSFVCLLKLSASFDCRSSHMKKLQQAYAIKFKGKFQLSVSKLASDVWWRLVVRTAFSFPPGPASRSLTETLLWHNEYKKLEINLSFWIEKDEKNRHVLYTERGGNSCHFPFSFCPLFLCESQHGPAMFVARRMVTDAVWSQWYLHSRENKNKDFPDSHLIQYNS